MLNAQEILSRWFRRSAMVLLAINCLVATPGVALRVVNNRMADEPRPGDDIYVVIKPQLTKDVLNNAVSTLKTKGITLTYANDVYSNGRLVSIDITIDVAVPGKPALTYQLSETNDGAFEPMIFYYESDGARVGFTRSVPTDLSYRGKKVVADNLVGMAILNGDTMQVHGGIRTNWKMR